MLPTSVRGIGLPAAWIEVFRLPAETCCAMLRADWRLQFRSKRIFGCWHAFVHLHPWAQRSRFGWFRGFGPFSSWLIMIRLNPFTFQQSASKVTVLPTSVRGIGLPAAWIEVFRLPAETCCAMLRVDWHLQFRSKWIFGCWHAFVGFDDAALDREHLHPWAQCSRFG